VNRAFRVSLGLVIGMVAGFGIGLLFVPRSGRDTQAEIQARIAEIRRAGQEAAQARRIELQQQFDEMTQPDRPAH
jgi:gas vesicle protein